MRNKAFWSSARVLLRYRRQLSLALLGALISAVCFGAGLGMLLPVLQLFFGGDQANQSQLELVEQMAAPDRPAYVQEAAAYARVQLVPEPRPPLQAFVEQRMMGQDRPAIVQDVGGWLIERLPQDTFDSFLLVMTVIAVLSVVGSSGRYLHELQTVTITLKAGQWWRSRMFRHLIRTPLALQLTHGTADHTGRMIFDTEQVLMGYRAILGKAVAELTKGAAALGLALWIDWQLTLIALVTAPVIAGLLRRFAKRIRRASRRALRTRGRMIAVLKESLSGMPVVKVHNAEGYERRRFSRQNRVLLDQQMRVRGTKALAGPLIDTIALLAVIVVASIAAWLIFRSGRPPEQFIAVLIALGAAGASLKPLSSLNSQISEAGAAAGRILEILDLPTEPLGAVDGGDGAVLPRHRRDVDFENVSFRYPGQDRFAIADINLHARFGQTVAIVGGNGSGKSTVLNLLVRLFSPERGRVLIDGIDLATANLRSLRAQVGVVTQHTVLFEGTIAQNIAYGRQHVSRESITGAAKAAFADEFIRGLPEGYDTVLGEDGSGLSGGQKQRLAIARAILRDPAILILDEATSQIDADSEAKINQALRDLRQGRTTFVVAHRLSTVMDAELIVVMADGRIVDRGTHDELMDRCATYQQLAKRQLQPTAGQ